MSSFVIACCLLIAAALAAEVWSPKGILILSPAPGMGSLRAWQCGCLPLPSPIRPELSALAHVNFGVGLIGECQTTKGAQKGEQRAAEAVALPRQAYS